VAEYVEIKQARKKPKQRSESKQQMRPGEYSLGASAMQWWWNGEAGVMKERKREKAGVS
jgi:hypothetical protein